MEFTCLYVNKYQFSACINKNSKMLLFRTMTILLRFSRMSNHQNGAVQHRAFE